MVGAMTQTADRCEQASPWSPREAEILAVTLRLLQEHGYDQLTVDAVAGAAHASKATVYRRWPSKAELVLAAFIEGVRQVAVLPNTGSCAATCWPWGRRSASRSATTPAPSAR